jgi:protein-S-isoprenylcysteine O-methyltransferase Ste14
VKVSLSPRVVRSLSVVATYALGAAVIALYLRGNLFSALPTVIAPQVAAGLLMLWARVTFGMRSFHMAANPPEGSLVTTGPYRLIRHPIYAAIWLFSWAGAAAHFSVTTALLTLLIALALATRIACEEFFLRTHFPGYAEYAAHTSRLIPFIL